MPSNEPTATIHKGPEDDVFFLGRNLSQFPCLRSSFLTGIFSGIAGGMAYLMYSSKPAHSSHAGMATFMVTTTGYWLHCRYGYYKTKKLLADADRTREERINLKKLDLEERRKELGVSDKPS